MLETTLLSGRARNRKIVHTFQATKSMPASMLASNASGLIVTVTVLTMCWQIRMRLRPLNTIKSIRTCLNF